MIYIKVNLFIFNAFVLLVEVSFNIRGDKYNLSRTFHSRGAFCFRVDH